LFAYHQGEQGGTRLSIFIIRFCQPLSFERGVKIIGATAHYITTELDAGPIIEQDVVRVTYKDTIDTLVNKGKDLEKIVLSRAVQKHIERKILTYKNKTVIFN